MKVTLLPHGKPGCEPCLSEAVGFGGHAAGICYMPDDFDAILAEPVEKTEKRIADTLQSGHHSVYDHVSYTLLLEGVPKILAMVLNNEKAYATSEKSARYTQMKPSQREQELYEKWIGILEVRIGAAYPDLSKMQIHKLAQENARYMISVFTPTTMAHTTTLRQWNYIFHWMERFLDQKRSGQLFAKLRPHVSEFLDCVDFLRVEGLNDDLKCRELSLFDVRDSHQEYFGEVYCTTYHGTFAQLAQAHRHRTIDYCMRLDVLPSFYTPMIVASNDGLNSDWLADITSVASVFPQGMMVKITERGTCENFILKTQERLCSSAQLEVSRQTWATLQRYLSAVKTSDEDLYDEVMSRHNKPARCGNGYKCPKPCKWGVGQLNRLV